MFSVKYFLKIIFNHELIFVFEDDDQVKKTFENFNHSYMKFNSFLKLLVVSYIIVCLFLNIILILIFFYKFRINFFEKVSSILKKIPLVKNVQNFIIANLFLHTN